MVGQDSDDILVNIILQHLEYTGSAIYRDKMSAPVPTWFIFNPSLDKLWHAQ